VGVSLLHHGPFGFPQSVERSKVMPTVMKDTPLTDKGPFRTVKIITLLHYKPKFLSYSLYINGENSLSANGPNLQGFSLLLLSSQIQGGA